MTSEEKSLPIRSQIGYHEILHQLIDNSGEGMKLLYMNHRPPVCVTDVCVVGIRVCEETDSKEPSYCSFYMVFMSIISP